MNAIPCITPTPNPVSRAPTQSGFEQDMIHRFFFKRPAFLNGDIFDSVKAYQSGSWAVFSNFALSLQRAFAFPNSRIFEVER